MRTIVRAAIACTAMTGAMTCAAAVTSRSYVQQGLVAQYDGIDNAGYGVHNDSAKIWKDLTGNGNDGTCASQLSWTANSWSVSGDCKPVTLGNSISSVTATGEYTIQFACTPAQTSLRESFFSQYNGGNEYGIGIEHNDGSSASGYLRFYSNGGGQHPGASPFLANEYVQGAITVSNKGKRIEFWKNGTSIGVKSYSSEPTCKSGIPSVIGGEPWPSSKRTGGRYDATYKMAFNGKYNAFRIYDRVLTANEIMVNAAVDAIRFNGANPGDFTLGGGWSFDGNGDLCVAVTATASGNGSVSGSATVKQYSTVTLVATPDSGAVFKCWTGDTDAITSGGIYSPSVMVTAADLVTLTAVFTTPKSGLDAYSYVRRGLVANFDGIDNAGTGSHDSSAPTWADLTGNGNDLTKAANVTWAADGWTNSAACKPMMQECSGLSAVTATRTFTAEFACKPSRTDTRECFFSQYNQRGVCIEHNSSGGNKTGGFLRFYANSSPVRDWNAHGIKILADEWASVSLACTPTAQTFRKNGTESLSANYDLNDTITNICPSVIGGCPNRDGMAFYGKYNAFRLYNLVLTEDEVKVNAAIDDKRFNNGAKGLQLPSGWSFANDDTLMVDVSATVTAGGKVSYRGGAAAASVSDTVNHDGSKVVKFMAIPDAGYVFDRWSGDIDLIEVGSVLTPEITLDPDRAISLVANFRRNGDAADGKVFDVSFTGDATADGLTFSATDAEETQRYVTANVTLPVLPTVTNANVACIYLPQPTNAAGTGTYRQMVQSDKPAVAGLVATVFCRFRWDGPVLPTVANYPDVLLNGYTSWYATGRGFIVRLFSAANSTDAYPGFVFPQRVVDGNSSDIENVSGTGIVKPGEWIDLFASVYPSPTNPSLSNADIWYCRVPSWNSGGYFTAPAIGHRHYGDILKIPRMDTTSTILQFGTEPGNSKGAATDANKAKCFRGAIAAAKGWNRILSEGERYTVMAGFDGVQTFNNAEIGTGRTVGTGTLSTMQGRYVTDTAFLGDANTAHFQRAMSTTYNTIKLVFDAPKSAKTYPYVYQTVIADAKSSNVHPVHLDFNGKTVWSSEDVAKGTEIRVELNEADALPGINELTWHYDTPIADNWVLFRFHQLRLGTTGMMIILK